MEEEVGNLMKKFLAIFLTALVFFSFHSLAHAESESVEEFQSQIRINRDGTVDVSEYFNYMFAGSKNGVYRELPLVKELDERGDEFGYKYDVLSVTNENGKNYHFEVKKDEKKGKIYIKIGDPRRVVETSKIYLIKYKVYGALSYGELEDSLIWNSTGRWNLPVKNPTASIEYYPGDLEYSKIKTQCNIGESLDPRSSDSCGSEFRGNAVYDSRRSVQPGESMWISIAFPKGLVDKNEAVRFKPLEDRWYGAMIMYFVRLFKPLPKFDPSSNSW